MAKVIVQTTRRKLLKGLASGLGLAACQAFNTGCSALTHIVAAQGDRGRRRPNILVFIADDMSWLHTGAAGCNFVNTSNFDRLAREGAYFENAFSSAPICTPSRSSLLTGLQPWQTEDGMQLLGTLAPELRTFPNVLAEDAGYSSGFTGKAWGPGNWRRSGRTKNPGGVPFFGAKSAQAATTGMRNDDLPQNFRRFLAERPSVRPFCFIFGSHEPHVPYEHGSGIRAGMDPADAEIPPFLPDAPEVRTDLLDYALEIEHLDAQLGACLAAIEDAGELEDTLVIFYGDNGMPFPSAKHTCREYGVHVPVVMRWGNVIPAGRRVPDLISTPDLTATIYSAAGIEPPFLPAGKDLLPGLRKPGGEPCLSGREFVVVGHERGNFCREGDLGYPMRAIREERYLYIRNYAPERGPVGDAPEYKDVDPILTKDMLLARKDDPDIAPFYRLAFGQRPADELYDIRTDPGCLNNIADDPPGRAIAANMRAKMETALCSEGDYRVLGKGDVFEKMAGRPRPRADAGRR